MVGYEINQKYVYRTETLGYIYIPSQVGNNGRLDSIRLTYVSLLNRLQRRTPVTFTFYDCQQEYLIQNHGNQRELHPFHISLFKQKPVNFPNIQAREKKI